MANKVKTLDGERTRVDELNLGDAQNDDAKTASGGRLARWLRNLNLVMAGMYTGLNCYGTPKAHHEYGDDEGEEQEKPDKRPI
ncbi:MAG: hypothetical protein RL839_03265 [Gammaproteobacteria bacterium]